MIIVAPQRTAANDCIEALHELRPVQHVWAQDGAYLVKVSPVWYALVAEDNFLRHDWADALIPTHDGRWHVMFENHGSALVTHFEQVYAECSVPAA